MKPQSEYKVTRSDNRSEYVLKFLYRDEWQELFRTWDIKQMAKWLSAHVDISTVPIRDGGPYRAFPIVESKSISMNLRDYLDSKPWTFQIQRFVKDTSWHAEPEQQEYESTSIAFQSAMGVRELADARKKNLPKPDWQARVLKGIYQDRIFWADGFIIEFSEPAQMRLDHIGLTVDDWRKQEAKSYDKAFEKLVNIVPLVPLGTVHSDPTCVVLASLDRSRVRAINAGYYGHFVRRYGESLTFEVGDAYDSAIALSVNGEMVGLVMPMGIGDPEYKLQIAGQIAKKFTGTYDALVRDEQERKAYQQQKYQESRKHWDSQPAYSSCWKEPAYATG